MESIGLVQFGFGALAVMAAFAVRGAAGFGAAAVAVPLTALVFPVQVVIPVIALLQFVSMSEYGIRNWRAVQWRELLHLAPAMVIGVACGTFLFATVQHGALTKGLGICVIAYAIYVLATSGRTAQPERRMPWPVAYLFNMTSALIGTTFGSAASTFYVIYLNALRLPRDTFRATITVVMLMLAAIRVVGYAGVGVISVRVLLLALAALPMMAAGAWLGERFVARIDQQTFTKTVGTLLVISGTALLFK